MNNALVFLHGFLGTPYDFGCLSQALKEKFNCVLVDLNSSESFDLSSQAQNIKKTLENLEIKKAHFWGYSMGGRVLLEFYKQFPDNCITLTLESTGLGLTDTNQCLKRMKQDQKWAIKILNDSGSFLEEWYSQELFSSIKGHQNFEQILATRQKNLSQKHAQMILEASPGNNEHHCDVIRNIEVPCLALVGEKDITYRGIWEKVVESNPKINVKVIPNSGHVVHLENPQQAVLEFLNFHK